MSLHKMLVLVRNGLLGGCGPTLGLKNIEDVKFF